MNEDLSVLLLNAYIDELPDKSAVSDGSHTFGELYHHRMVLFSVLCNTYASRAWKSWTHADGSMFPGYFIAGITTPDGQFTYHYHKDHWDAFHVSELPAAPEWDGHEAADVIRLYSLNDPQKEETE